VLPGLVRVLHEFGSDPLFITETSDTYPTRVTHALSCLVHIMEYEIDHPTGILWESAYDSGIVPALCDLIRPDAGLAIPYVLALCTYLVYITPPGHEKRWGDTLPRAVARLLTTRSTVAPALTIDVLTTMCDSNRHLLEDSHTWGLGDILEDLTKHSNMHTAGAAKELLCIMSSRLDVSPSQPSSLSLVTW
jgi:hypothetical protein